MANTITHKRSSTSSEAPSASDLSAGEIALNTADAKLFIKKSDNSIATFVSSGMPTTGGTFTGDVTFTGNNYNVVWDKTDNALEFAVDAKAEFGGGTDIFVNSAGNTIFNVTGGGTATGDLYLQNLNDDKSVFIRTDAGNGQVADYVKADGATGGVNLYHYGAERLRTQSTGIKVTGELDFGDSVNNDVSLIRIGNNATTFGFNIKYMGSRTGNDNALSIFTDQQQSGEASLEAITISQNGYTRFTNQIQVDGDIFIGDDLDFFSDGAILKFGAGDEVTLTHVHDTGLLLNGAMQLQFGDSGTYIHQSADGVLDLVSDTEIEINATTIDMNGNLDVSGTITSGGNEVATNGFATAMAIAL